MKTMFRIAGAGVAAALLSAFPVLAQPDAKPAAPVGEEARIPFADTVGIRNFRAESDEALYIQAQNGRWYYATTFGPCSGLDFTNHIGIVTKGAGMLDRFSQIVVDGRTCPLSSLVTANAPPRKAKDAEDGRDVETGQQQGGEG